MSTTKTWFITGTSSGFGRQLTERLLKRGDRVAATVRRRAAVEDLIAAYGDQLRVAELDVTDGAAVRNVVDGAFAALGTIDVIVNNAGYGLFAAVEEASAAQIRHVVDTNLHGSIAVIRAALPHLRAQGHGRILQVSSAGGQIAIPNYSYYHAAKWGIEGFCEAVAPEIAPFGIGLTIVEPGAAPTRFLDALATAPVMAEYDATPAGDVRRAITSGAISSDNDPGLVAEAMIASADGPDAPLRLPLGPDCYHHVRASLTARLDAHDAHREVALSVARAA
ncbi:SDR family oxidoreductase [Actinoplanes couchii]|uniref:Short-chain dehydrogenase/reductase n=1 Tax=Actinoplanes couchii TaxID=403638 RepID=A0ABQ3XTT8_9ACTN|nr:SDR family oxidoreductase [Actinoplanes couchii]MDR6317761.1 NAD(P)-dependent dehydrogenase (short-subunit alcohol dehydrogenase family) [Actinoplanes couchii]GID61929.1 short-chain dehydrogenase/reductase [Actinoplanes couchii]